MMHALPAALDALDRLLGDQAQALQAGDADALPSLARGLSQGLALLARTADRDPVPASLRPRLQALVQRARASQALLARRQHHVEQSLHSLGAAHAGLQEMQARRVYGAGGTLSSTPWRSGAFERA